MVHALKMSDQEKLRRLANTQPGKIYSKRGKKPELQIHIAATLVMAGDPNAKDPSAQCDMSDEICQYVAKFDPKKTGNIQSSELNRVMVELKAAIVNKLRDRGVLGPGV